MGTCKCYKKITLALILYGLTGCATDKVEKHEYTHQQKARLLLNLANGALAENDPTGALQNLLQAEAEDPNLAEIYHSKAIAFYSKHDTEQAIIEVKKALKIHPDYAEACNTYGRLLIEAGRFGEAIRPLNVAAKNPLYRDSYKAFTNLGILYYKQGQYPEAIDNLDHAILAAPNLACIAYYYRGHVRMRESKLNEAIKDYDQATKKLCAGFADAHLALGIAYEHGKKYDSARKKFVEIQQRYPDTQIAKQAMTHLRDLP